MKNTMREATKPSENPGECLRPSKKKIRKKEQADYRTPWRRNTGKVIEAPSKLARHPNRREIQENRVTPHRTSTKKQPAAERRRARISVTRISTIAHAAARCTQNRKRSRYSRPMTEWALN